MIDFHNELLDSLWKSVIHSHHYQFCYLLLISLFATYNSTFLA